MHNPFPPPTQGIWQRSLQGGPNWHHALLWTGQSILCLQIQTLFGSLTVFCLSALFRSSFPALPSSLPIRMTDKYGLTGHTEAHRASVVFRRWGLVGQALWQPTWSGTTPLFLPPSPVMPSCPSRPQAGMADMVRHFA